MFIQTLPKSMNRFLLSKHIHNNNIKVSTYHGQSWFVLLEFIDDDFCLTNGWSKVVHDLCFSMFYVIFDFIAPNTFMMKHYNHSPSMQLDLSFCKMIEHELTTPMVSAIKFDTLYYMFLVS